MEILQMKSEVQYARQMAEEEVQAVDQKRIKLAAKVEQLEA